MPEKCSETCLMETRISALERANEQHGATHREVFDRLRALETSDAVQKEQYATILSKLDTLSAAVDELKSKPGRRWDAVVEKVILLAVGAAAALMLARLGLSL